MCKFFENFCVFDNEPNYPNYLLLVFFLVTHCVNGQSITLLQKHVSKNLINHVHACSN